MQAHLESLERRKFLSVTAATLATDKAVVLSGAAEVFSAAKASGQVSRANDPAVLRDAKGVAGNKPLVKKFQQDEARGRALFEKTLNQLLKPAEAVAKGSQTLGASYLKKASAKKLLQLEAKGASLASITVSPLASVEAILNGTTVTDDLEALRVANPTNASLSAAITQRENGSAGSRTEILGAANTFQARVQAMAADLASIFAG